MSARDEKFDPNRPRSTPPVRGRTKEEVRDEERVPSSSRSEADDEGAGADLPRTAEIDREASKEFEERRRSGEPDKGT